MSHCIRETTFCSIDIDTDLGKVLLQERWKYYWLKAGNVKPWTDAEKRGFHTRADLAVWAAWSNKVTLAVSGKSAFAKRFASAALPINLDIRWVTVNPHWRVNVTKIKPGTFQQSNVDWNNKIINLDTEDFTTRTICSGTPQVCDKQIPVAHEFGHTLGNTWVYGTGDEYNSTSPNFNDHSSILHHGNTLRRRHFQVILGEMSHMIPDTVFIIRSI